MLTYQFFGQNLHFITGLFTALVFFAVFWLYFDAWTGRRQRKDLLKWLGFGVLSISYLCYAVIIEQPVFGGSPFGHLAQILNTVLRLAGYGLVISGQLVDPLQPIPHTRGLELENQTDSPDTNTLKAAGAGVFGLKLVSLQAILPFGSFAIAWLYFRHSIKGLERHLLPVAIAFGLFGLADVVDLIQQATSVTTNPLWYALVSPFGWLWELHQVLLLAAAIILGRWVWRYLVDRFMSQLFMIFTIMIISIFLVITVCFTAVLVHNVQNEAVNNLKTTARTLQYAVTAKQEQTAAAAHILSHDPSVIAAVEAQDHDQLVRLSGSSLSAYQLSSLIITSDESKVLLRAEDPRRWADSVSSNTLVQRSLIGQARTSITVVPGVASPVMYFTSGYPIRDASGQIIGTVITGIKADNALVDGIKTATGLSSSLYAGNIRSATTLTAADGNRQTGTIEHNPTINKEVLQKGHLYAGSLNLLNRSYTGVYSPLKDVDNEVVGMLFVGRPEVDILALAGRSIQTTFAVATLLLLVSILPAYLTARYLAKQLE